MSGCRDRFGEDAGCALGQPMSHFLRFSAIVATSLFLCITVVLVIVVLHKRGVFLWLRFRPRVPRVPPALYVWSAPAATDDPPSTQPQSTTPPPPAKSSKKLAKASSPPEPLSCVIMAGDDRPTHLARALPRDEFVDVKLDELERGKHKATPLISSR